MGDQKGNSKLSFWASAMGIVICAWTGLWMLFGNLEMVESTPPIYMLYSTIVVGLCASISSFSRAHRSE